MILAPTFGPIGIQPHGATAKVINRHSSAVAVGDVVITSFAHTSAAYSTAPADDAALRLSPFSCVKLAEGDAGATSEAGDHAQAGYLGVVIGLGNQAGAAGSEIDVQFGGIAAANCAATTNNIVLGSKLYLSDTAGRFANAAGSTAPDTTCAISLGAVTAAATGVINVLLFNGPIDCTTQ
jgi:hypothetical protein